MGPKIMSLNGVCVSVCDPRSTETKQKNENLFTYLSKENNDCVTDSMCIHSQTVLLMYHLLRTT